MVTLTAKGGNYDEVEKEVTYTVGYFGPDPVSNVKVMVSNSVAPNGMAKVTWDEPKTRKEIKQYRVTVTGVGTGADAPTVTIDGETADITEMKTGTAMVTVEVIYADDMVVLTCCSSACRQACCLIAIHLRHKVKKPPPGGFFIARNIPSLPP